MGAVCGRRLASERRWRPLPDCCCCCHEQLPAAAAAVAAAVPGRHPPGGVGEVQSRVWTKNWLPEAALACASPGPGAGWAGQRPPASGAARAASRLRTPRNFSSCEGAGSVQRSGTGEADFQSVGEGEGEKELGRRTSGGGGWKEGEDGCAEQLRKTLWAPKTLPQPDTNHPLTTDCIHVSLLHFWLLYDFVDYDRRRSVTLVLLRLHALISDSFVIFSNV